LAHRLAAVEREDDLVVALRLVLTRVEAGMPRARLPVDSAPVHARFVLAQGLELRAFAADTPGDQAELGVAQEGLQSRRADRRQIGPNAHRLLKGPVHLAVGEPEGARPAEPQVVERACAPADRDELDFTDTDVGKRALL